MPDGLEGEERRRNVIGSLGGVWAELTGHVKRQLFGIGGTILLSIIGGLFWSGYYFYQFDQEYKPLPRQVESLEAHQTHAESNVFPRVDSLSNSVDSLRSDLQSANSDRREIILRLDNLESAISQTRCFAAAAAGQGSPYECGT